MRRWITHAVWDIDPAIPALDAFVARSSWAVICECNEQWVIEPGEPAFCPNCLNAPYGGKARNINWPDDATRASIELLLNARWDPRTRNWIASDDVSKRAWGGAEPAETVDDLNQQNADNGELTLDQLQAPTQTTGLGNITQSAPVTPDPNGPDGPTFADPDNGIDPLLLQGG